MRKYIIGIVVGVLLSSAVFVWAGNLDSPDVPANTLSYNLEDIYNRLDSGAAGVQTGFTEPVAGPGATGHTLDEVMANAPARDDANGAATGEVGNGKTFWGLNVAGGEWGLQTGTADCSGGGAGVPKTGQDKCYDVSSNAEETCAPEHDGQDAYEDKGVAWPDPRFTDNGDGTVTDNLTGLIWLENANCYGQQSWANALSDANALANGTCSLNDGSSAGDWRLPNVRELHSLIDSSQPTGTATVALPSGHPFTGVQSLYYWSSTTYAGNTTPAWYVDLNNGFVFNDNKTNAVYVWPVRGGQ